MRQIMRATHRLLKVVMCLKNQKKSEYIIGVATSLSVLEWMKSVDHPVWKMLVADPTMLLEEIGEISFSVLARSLNTGVRQDRDRVSKLYKLSHKQIETAQKLKVDNENDDDFLNNMIGKYIDPNHETVQAVTAYFSSAMRQLKALTYKSYPQGHSVNIANSNAGDAIAVDLDIEPRIWLQPKCDLIPVVLKEMKERLRSHWVTNFKEIWPEVNPPESSMQSNQARRPGHVRRDDGSQIQARGVGGNNNSNRNQSNSVMRSDQKEEKKNIKSKKKRKKTAKSNATRPKKKKKKKKARRQHERDDFSDCGLENIPVPEGTEELEDHTPWEIMGEETRDGEPKFCIQWSGYPEKKDWTWEPVAKFEHSAFDKLRAWWYEHGGEQ